MNELSEYEKVEQYIISERKKQIESIRRVKLAETFLSTIGVKQPTKAIKKIYKSHRLVNLQ